MRATNTKERILDAALELFASQGYEQVTMEDIARAVGIKAPSLYKHYSGKQEIYDSLIKRSEQIFYKFSAALGITADQEVTTQNILQFDVEAMTEIGLQLFDFLLHDHDTVRLRKMLTMRQYSDKNLADIYIGFYLEQPMKYQGAAAAAIAQAAGMVEADAEQLGLEFYAPIFLLISRCDLEPGYEPKAKRLLKKHMEHSFASMGKKG